MNHPLPESIAGTAAHDPPEVLMLVRRHAFPLLTAVAFGAWLVACHDDSTRLPSRQTGPLLYGIAPANDGYTLARIDTGTGAVEHVQAIEDSTGGLVAGSERRLFAIETSDATHLVTFDATTGSRTHDVEIPPSQLAGFEALTGKVLAITASDDRPATIVRIDPETGDVEEGARVEGNASLSLRLPLAFDGSHQIAGVDQKPTPDGTSFGPAALVVIDVATGSVQRIEAGQRELEYPVFDPRSGRLYALSVDETSSIVVVDPTTGEVENFAGLPMNRASGVTFDAGFGRFLVLGNFRGPMDDDQSARNHVVGVDIESGDILTAPAVDSNIVFASPAFVN